MREEMEETRTCHSQRCREGGLGALVGGGQCGSDEVVTGTLGPDVQGYHLVSGLRSS